MITYEWQIWGRDVDTDFTVTLYSAFIYLFIFFILQYTKHDILVNTYEIAQKCKKLM